MKALHIREKDRTCICMMEKDKTYWQKDDGLFHASYWLATFTAPWTVKLLWTMSTYRNISKGISLMTMAEQDYNQEKQ